MITKTVRLEELKPCKKNTRIHPEGQIVELEKSLKEFGQYRPIIADVEGNIIVGNGLYEALIRQGAETCEIKELPINCTEEFKKKLMLADNKIYSLGEDNDANINELLAELEGVEIPGFNEEELEELSQGLGELEEKEGEKDFHLVDKFIILPLSVLNASKMRERQKKWDVILDDLKGRRENLLGVSELIATIGRGTSRFNSVLCEFLIRWFCPLKGKILDPFAGGSVRGIVSWVLEREYYGIDLREEQINANKSNFENIRNREEFKENKTTPPVWIKGNSLQVDNLIKENDFDFLLTCPPYGDLEKYSSDPNDLSNMDKEKFNLNFKEIIIKSCSRLKEDCFASIVVSNYRDKKGFYNFFVGEVVSAFTQAGFKLYNDCILAEPLGTMAIRLNKVFLKRKMGKVHQNVLIFARGKIDNILNKLEKFTYSEEDSAELE